MSDISEGSAASELASYLAVNAEGLPNRNNHPSVLLRGAAAHLEAVRSEAWSSIPPPLCVQLQITDTCATHCTMCDKWTDTSKTQPELTLAEWKDVISELGASGVGSVILSGGEPMLHPDFVELLTFIRASGLRIGLLTSGITDDSNDVFTVKADAVRSNVDWVAISVEGTSYVDARIRRSKASTARWDRLRQFCSTLSAGTGITVSATVTLQRLNVSMDLEVAQKEIADLGITQVNFKLATGYRDALMRKPAYLAELEQLEDLVESMYENRLADAPGNNLDYLRRCFADGVFNVADAAAGGPVRTFYQQNRLQCFTTVLFALIDIDGSVYPCCHLYRDNHGQDRSTRQWREQHRMGDVRNQRFSALWNGEPYVNERLRLQVINPVDDFAPCAECTRHCQQNRVLSHVLSATESHEAIDELVARGGESDGPIWL
jgi:MoaA/NifB/PqqE/SkfB family radical SAM enzyme